MILSGIMQQSSYRLLHGGYPSPEGTRTRKLERSCLLLPNTVLLAQRLRCEWHKKTFKADLASSPLPSTTTRRHTTTTHSLRHHHPSSDILTGILNTSHQYSTFPPASHHQQHLISHVPPHSPHYGPYPRGLDKTSSRPQSQAK